MQINKYTKYKQRSRVKLLEGIERYLEYLFGNFYQMPQVARVVICVFITEEQIVLENGNSRRITG